MSLDADAEVWQLPIVGFEVTDIWFSFQLYVVAYGPGGDARIGKAAPRTSITFGGAFTLRSPDGIEHHLNAAEAWDTLVLVLSLRHGVIAAATAHRNGVLKMIFTDGAALYAEPDPSDENWELVGPGALRLVATPGGGVAMWT